MQLQYLLHTWPDIKVATTFAKQDPNPQAGVAVLIPAGWELSCQKVLVEHYAVAACVVFQACPVWIASVYLPPKSPKALVEQIFKALLTLETHPVFIGGDFNRCDQHHPQIWEDFLGQLGATDIDPTFPTYRFGEQQESPLDRFLVPSFFLDTTQLHVRVAGRYRVNTCHHKTITALLSMKPRLTPHPQSEKHCTIPTKVFLDPTAFSVGEVEAKRQQALHLLRRCISLAQESCAVNVPLSIHVRALVWSWWRNSSKIFKHISPLTKLYKRLGKGQLVLHINREVLQHLYEQSGLVELLQPWPKQYDQSLAPGDVIATALQTAEIATTMLTQLPFGQEHTDPARRARRQKYSGIVSKLSVRGVHSTMVLSCRKMARSVKPLKNTMKQCLPHETSGFSCQFATTQRGPQRLQRIARTPSPGLKSQSQRLMITWNTFYSPRTQLQGLTAFPMPFGACFRSNQLPSFRVTLTA